MILGRIIGKSMTSRFEFIAKSAAKKLEYCQVYHKEHDYVLCQIIELEKTSDRIIAKCIVIGFKDKRGRIKQIRSPFDIGTEVLKADEEFIKNVIMTDWADKGAFVGKLEGTDICAYLDLNRLLTKHIAVLAKSGSGKSYTVGVLLEEIMQKNVPLVILDPHGEYCEMKKSNDKKEDIERLSSYSLKPKAYNKKIIEYGDINLDPAMKPILLNERLSAKELIDILPAKLSNNQIGILYSILKEMDSFTFSELIQRLQGCESSNKWSLINIIEYVAKLKLFSPQPTSLNEIVQTGRASIINLKGIDPEIQEIIVYKLLKDLFSERKKNNIPPFFLVIEEAHNYVPEKGHSESRSSGIIKTIASEGRKFGLGLCVVSQRPAIVQKTVLSQCTTQIILKITNPNDLKAISNSVEGITYEAENEIKNLPVGTALITGVAEVPLFVNIRPRKSKHGGEAVDMLGQCEESNFFDELKEHKDKGMLPVIKPDITKKDMMLMSEQGVQIKTSLIPCMLFLCKNKACEFNLLVEMVNGSVVIETSNNKIKTAFLPELENLSKEELKILETCFRLKSFTVSDLIKKAGAPIDSGEIVSGLEKKGFFRKDNETYSFSGKYILSNLSKNAFYKKIEYVNLNYGKMLEKKQRIDSIKAKISRFTTVLDQRECYFVYYYADKTGRND